MARQRAPRQGQRGVALIVTMVVLLLLSILGITVLTSTTSELQITTSYKSNCDAFYAASAALELAHADARIYSALAPSTASVWPPSGEGVKLRDDGSPRVPQAQNDPYPDYNQITLYKDPLTKLQPQGTANIKVEYLGVGAVPPGLGTEVDAGIGGGTGFEAQFYLISVIADGAHDRSHVEIESQTARVVPK